MLSSATTARCLDDRVLHLCPKLPARRRRQETRRIPTGRTFARCNWGKLRGRFSVPFRGQSLLASIRKRSAATRMQTKCEPAVVVCDPNVGAARTGTSASSGAAAGVMEIANPEKPRRENSPCTRDRPVTPRPALPGSGSGADRVSDDSRVSDLRFSHVSPGCPLFWRHARAIPQYSSRCPSCAGVACGEGGGRACAGHAARAHATPSARSY